MSDALRIPVPTPHSQVGTETRSHSHHEKLVTVRASRRPVAAGLLAQLSGVHEHVAA